MEAWNINQIMTKILNNKVTDDSFKCMKISAMNASYGIGPTELAMQTRLSYQIANKIYVYKKS